MPVTYETTGDRVRDARERTQRMIDQYHPELRDVELTFAILMASPPTDKNGDPSGPAVSHGGYPCAAKIKVTPYPYRCLRIPDVQVFIDADWWECLTGRQRDALVDHEITHITLATDADGAVSRDDADRPKIKMRKHDRRVEGFDEVVRRHGESAPEQMAWRDFDRARVQQWLFDAQPDEELVDEDEEELAHV